MFRWSPTHPSCAQVTGRPLDVRQARRIQPRFEGAVSQNPELEFQFTVRGPPPHSCKLALLAHRGATQRRAVQPPCFSVRVCAAVRQLSLSLCMQVDDVAHRLRAESVEQKKLWLQALEQVSPGVMSTAVAG